MAAPKAAQTAGSMINFGDLGMYVAGGAFVPDGDYIAFFNVIMHQARDAQQVAKGPVRLGVMADYFPFDNPNEEHKVTQFYSMGSKADQSFAPNPETGKGIVAIPGAQGGSLNDKTNWAFLLKSFYDSGLPQGIFAGDIGVLDGVWVHITNIDEPAERASFQSATAEVAQEPRRVGKIAVVTEIKEGGAPWEGGGGLPEAAKPGPKAVAKPAAKPAAAAPKPAAKPAAVADVGGDDVRDAAADCITDVLTANPNGLPRLKLGTETFKVASKKFSEEVAAQIAEGFFKGPNATENLANLVGELGFTVAGASVKPA